MEKFDNIQELFDRINTVGKDVKGLEFECFEWFDERYQLIRLLGKGESSLVFLAIDTLLDREIALKVMNFLTYNYRPNFFIREAKILARFNNPYIVKIFDYGIENKTNIPWISMEYLGDVTLRDYVNEHSELEDISDLSNLMKQIAMVVEYCHEVLGFYQLDLKPENFMFIEKAQKIKYIDLGSLETEGLLLGKKFGTPGYLSPEMLTKKTIDKSSDIFSLGVLFYELITGDNPFLVSQELSLRNTIKKRDNNLFDEDRFKTMVFSIAISIDNEFETDAIEVLLEQIRNFNPNNNFQKSKGRNDILRIISDCVSYESDKRPDIKEIICLFGNSNLHSITNPQIFISHSSLDKERFVRDFANRLKSAGFKIWIDEENLLIGEPFWKIIGNAIEECDYIIVILSSNSVNSFGVNEELNMAVLDNLDKVKILPLRIDNIDFKSIPLFLRSRHVMNFTGWEQNDTFNNNMITLIDNIGLIEKKKNIP